MRLCKLFQMLFSEKTHHFIYISAFLVMACALPYSLFTVNVCLITLLSNWVLDFRWKEKIKRFQNTPTLWAFLLIYLSVVISFFYSENLIRANREIRMWLPMLIIPIVVATSQPLQKKEFKGILLLFSLSLSYTTFEGLYTFIRYFDQIGQNVRFLSPYLLHIRLSILINIAIFSLWYLSINKSFYNSILIRILLFALSIWFVVFLLILQSVTGIVIFVIVSILLLLWFAFRSKNTIVKYSLAVCFLSVFLLIVSYLTHEIDSYFTRSPINLENLPQKTINGNLYRHDTLSRQYENSHLVWINICDIELERGWQRVSKLPFNGKDNAGNNIAMTTIRYLASKGLTKDSIGLSKLDSIDVRKIENGVSSVIYRDHKIGFYPRFYQLLWEIDMYRTFGTISGSSVVQRFIFLKSTWGIIKSNFFFGVGVGDAKDELFKYYKENVPNLLQKSWKSTHNQYLYIWLTSGIVGLTMFLFGFLFPFFYKKMYRHLLPFTFIMILVISMFSIETFERFLGTSFIALFYSIFIFGYNFEQDAS